nr:MAG TPA: hypothetical protein [Bacteriophage sp.]
MILLIIHVISALIVTFSCIFRLNAVQFGARSLLLWSYALLGASGVVVLARAWHGQMPTLSEWSANCGMAIYFLARSKTVRQFVKHWQSPLPLRRVSDVPSTKKIKGKL